MNSEYSLLLQQLNQPLEHGWLIEDGMLCKNFSFSNFISAFGFMTQVAIISEQQNHHPNWSNVYNTVKIKLFTHDENKITEKDFKLAKAIEQILSSSAD